jgi:hypothetical protein
VTDLRQKFPVRSVLVDVAGAEANRNLAEHRKGGKLVSRVYPQHAIRCMYKAQRANYTCTCGAEELWQAWKAEARS